MTYTSKHKNALYGCISITNIFFEAKKKIGEQMKSFTFSTDIKVITNLQEKIHLILDKHESLNIFVALSLKNTTL